MLNVVCSGGLIKVLWHDGQGMCLFAKRLERGRFVWPSTAQRDGADRTQRDGADRTVTITPAQLGYLLEGIDWRLPQHTSRPGFGAVETATRPMNPSVLKFHCEQYCSLDPR